ncbi:hypothetical protein RT97_26555 [Variovorax paradoxus]|uniref:DUF3613 domain-containing protein n=1 Tax=Variovorax paradoxus TaxID=34073 RepID=A0A0D0LPB7_VARPD|nr:DUF3613 domain-containing protein [Variovorax paradoxus]KIQ21851.1 hypothetical protein RT97_26555 [Variovorax paradoxus]
MKKEHAFRFAALSSAFGVSVALMVFAPVALAQEAKPAAPMTKSQAQPTAAPATAPVPSHDHEEMAEDEDFVYEPLQVGDATQGLLAWQRSGEIASTTPRPIAGSVANRSYERYLKSFEFPIPERMSSSVKSSSGSGSSATAPR